tara:strand:+ start:18 stop:149 length:132 start_codon:yes stop_codon:yes gene_type:complete
MKKKRKNGFLKYKIYWIKMSKGGHFAALEQPELLVKDVFRFTN